MKDFLGLQLRDIPYFRALLRAVEARFYQGIDLPSPTLDLGCGDGQFAEVTFDSPLEAGVDPWWEPLSSAPGRAAYQLLSQAEGAHLPFPSQYFSSAISNSVLEHIPDLDPVLQDLNRVLKPGASFVFCVPNQRFTAHLSLGRALDSVGLQSLGSGYRKFFNAISRHHHCDPPRVWEARLGRNGFIIEDHWDYFSPAALRVLEWGHYFGLPSWVSKKIFNRWILVPASWNLYLTRKAVEKYYLENPRQEQGAYTFYRTRKV
ncbi:MAG: class I SAM-dependent methyltransferase [Anaerolineales bacterium]|nr:class I SAM-dependent methyltransferase [Anaerolineales bacterium]